MSIKWPRAAFAHCAFTGISPNHLGLLMANCPLAGRVVVGKAAHSWQEHIDVIMVAEPGRVEDDLAGGVLACPRCGGVLRPWSYAATRRVRQLDGSTRPIRPRRARCAACRAAQVLLPGSLLPRRADAVEVIGAALLARVHGRGWRRIAAELDRPPATVRRWLRGSRPAPGLAAPPGRRTRRPA